jgi:seryl-tRNA synthetase
MNHIQTLRKEPEMVIARLQIKNFDAKEIVQEILKLDEERRTAQKQLDQNLSELNTLSRQIGDVIKSGDQTQAGVLREQTASLKAGAKQLEDKMRSAEEAQNHLLILLPNLPHESVNPGKSADDNEITRQEGSLPELDDKALPHWELAGTFNIIDFEAGNRITGAGFPVYKGYGARLQRALINFFLDEALAAGYSEVQPPYMVNEASAFGTGQLPDKDGQMYHVTVDNLYLIPTAEVPVTNIYRGLILKETELPVKNVAYSACFRREAGSYGSDVRGLNRLHQFDKVEIVQVQHPDRSYETLEEMKEYVASLLQKLELPFRILRLCGGDMSFTSALTYDFEVYSAAQKKWLEVSSVSNFESFQANRMKLRFRDKEGKNHAAHTLNGSALALPRVVAALLENNQCAEGIRIPAALTPYTKFAFIPSI